MHQLAALQTGVNLLALQNDRVIDKMIARQHAARTSDEFDIRY